jgi:hypothetical protein
MIALESQVYSLDLKVSFLVLSHACLNFKRALGVFSGWPPM